MAARTNAQLKARYLSTDPADAYGDLTDSFQNIGDDFEGNTIGEHRHSVQQLTASGAITLNSGVVLLNHATVAIEATLDAPTAGDELYIIDSSASGTAAHTVTCAEGVTFDGTNDIATFNAPGEALHIVAISATRWFIMENIASVGLSASGG